MSNKDRHEKALEWAMTPVAGTETDRLTREGKYTRVTYSGNSDDILTLVGCPQCRVALYVGDGLGYSYCPRCNHRLTSDDMLRGTLPEIRAHASRHGWYAESTEIQRLLSPWEHT